jgi:hypothetical protein
LVFLKQKKSADMNTDIRIRSQILKKIQKIPSYRLKELDDFVSKLERTAGKKDRILSFAGAWENIETSIFDEFTENLISNRQKNRTRIDE